MIFDSRNKTSKLSDGKAKTPRQVGLTKKKKEVIEELQEDYNRAWKQQKDAIGYWEDGNLYVRSLEEGAWTISTEVYFEYYDNVHYSEYQKWMYINDSHLSTEIRFKKEWAGRWKRNYKLGKYDQYGAYNERWNDTNDGIVFSIPIDITKITGDYDKDDEYLEKLTKKAYSEAIRRIRSVLRDKWRESMRRNSIRPTESYPPGTRGV